MTRIIIAGVLLAALAGAPRVTWANGCDADEPLSEQVWRCDNNGMVCSNLDGPSSAHCNVGCGPGRCVRKTPVIG